jgi:hypothetical protein
MTRRLSCPPVPGLLEDYAAQFDPLFARLAHRPGRYAPCIAGARSAMLLFGRQRRQLVLPAESRRRRASMGGAAGSTAAVFRARTHRGRAVETVW